jgi:hypothetical protein
MRWDVLGAGIGGALSKGAEEYYGRRDEEREDLYNQAVEYNKLIGPQNFNQGQVQQFFEGLQGNRVVDDRLRRRLEGLQQLGTAQVKTDAQKMAEIAGMEDSEFFHQDFVQDLMQSMNMDVEGQQVEGWQHIPSLTGQPATLPRGTTPGGIGRIQVPAAMGTDPSQGWQHGGLVPGSDLQRFMDTQEARRGALGEQAHFTGDVERQIRGLDQEALYKQLYEPGGLHYLKEQAELETAVAEFSRLDPMERQAAIGEYTERLGLDLEHAEALYRNERAFEVEFLPQMIKQLRQSAWAQRGPELIQTMNPDGTLNIEPLFPFTSRGPANINIGPDGVAQVSPGTDFIQGYRARPPIGLEGKPVVDEMQSLIMQQYRRQLGLDDPPPIRPTDEEIIDQYNIWFGGGPEEPVVPPPVVPPPPPEDGSLTMDSGPGVLSSLDSALRAASNVGDDRTEQAANTLPVPAVGLAADWAAENLGRARHPATRYQLSQLLRPDFPESVGRPAGMQLSIADKNRVLDTLASAANASIDPEELDAFLAEWFTNPEAVKAILEGQ